MDNSSDDCPHDSITIHKTTDWKGRARFFGLCPDCGFKGNAGLTAEVASRRLREHKSFAKIAPTAAQESRRQIKPE